MNDERVIDTKWPTCDFRNNQNLMKIWGTRTLASISILNILPMFYLWIMMILIGRYNQIKFTFTFTSLTTLFFIFWSSLGVFGFYRLYYVLFSTHFRELFFDMMDILVENRHMSFDPLAHLMWSIIYLLPGIDFFIYKTANIHYPFFPIILISFVLALSFTYIINRNMSRYTSNNPLDDAPQINLYLTFFLSIFSFIFLISLLNLVTYIDP